MIERNKQHGSLLNMHTVDVSKEMMLKLSGIIPVSRGAAGIGIQRISTVSTMNPFIARIPNEVSS